MIWLVSKFFFHKNKERWVTFILKNKYKMYSISLQSAYFLTPHENLIILQLVEQILYVIH